MIQLKLRLVALLCICLVSTLALGQTPADTCRFVTAADLSDPKSPSFANYSVKTENAVEAPELDLASNPVARTYRTLLRREITKGTNYAGHYRVVIWGCGSSCARFTVVDLKNGTVITAAGLSSTSGVHLAADDFLPESSGSWGFRYRTDSSLLVILGAPDEDDARAGAYYFVVQGDQLRLIYTTLVRKHCEGPQP